MDAHLQGVEVEAVVGGDHDLAVDDAAAGQVLLERVDELGKVPAQGLAALRLKRHRVPILECHAAEAIPFRLVKPAAAGGDVGDEFRLHRGERGLDREDQARDAGHIGRLVERPHASRDPGAINDDVVVGERHHLALRARQAGVACSG